ncbi:hypothetical protein [Bradyrhizobium symbiodeficiens]|uniref:hypothetical protein n=1 Tax=Bradyrhizobium symbiodeficiens TaxID=1404367 RepID=UPI00140FE6ED|nr:hypothetical protein [Bradyrhizobium symbiodeficiens]QIP01945.1 hypothetical protein HAU86_20100 [Bradyrhizobium symbiodeficiens]
MFLRVEFRAVGRLRAPHMRMGSGGLRALRGRRWSTLQPSRHGAPARMFDNIP